MKFITPLILMLLIFFECRVFKWRDKEMFDEVFGLSKRTVILLTILLTAILFSPQRDNLLIVVTLVIMVPVYILRRQDFIHRYDPKRVSVSRSALLSDGIGLVINWLFTLAVASMLGGSLLMMYPGAMSEFSELIVSAAFSSFIIFILIYLASQKFSNNGFFVNVALIRQNRSPIRLFFVPILVGLIFASLSAFLLVNRVVQPDTPLSQAMQTADSSVPILLFLFLGLFVAPFVEEITFRGYFFHLVDKIKGRVFAICSISLMFGILHVGQYWGDWLAITIVCALGFVLTFLRVWANSTIASVVTHYTYNIGVTLIPAIFFIVTNPAYVDYQVNFEKYDTIQKEALLLESIEIKPKFYEAYNDLAWLYAQEDMRLETALELINQALEYDPKNPHYLDTKKAVLDKLERTPIY